MRDLCRDKTVGCGILHIGRNRVIVGGAFVIGVVDDHNVGSLFDPVGIEDIADIPADADSGNASLNEHGKSAACRCDGNTDRLCKVNSVFGHGRNDGIDSVAARVVVVKRKRRCIFGKNGRFSRNGFLNGVGDCLFRRRLGPRKGYSGHGASCRRDRKCSDLVSVSDRLRYLLCRRKRSSVNRT